MSFSRGLPNPGIKPASPALAGRFSATESPGKCSKKSCFSKYDLKWIEFKFPKHAFLRIFLKDSFY